MEVIFAYMDNVSKRIGIPGGTFDPIHIGHLIIAQYALECLKLDKVVFIPSGKPPHKDSNSVTDAEHRYNMTAEAVFGNDQFEVSDLEINREGYTYTVDTLTQLRQLYGERAKLFFIIGADNIKEIVNWKDAEKLFGMCEFVAFMRPGFDDSYYKQIEDLRKTYKAEIHVIKAPLIDISSTMIRNRVAEGKSVKYMLPERVEKYIIKNGLYKGH